MGSIFSKKKEPELEKPKITKQDKEVLVSSNIQLATSASKTNFSKESKIQQWFNWWTFSSKNGLDPKGTVI